MTTPPRGLVARLRMSRARNRKHPLCAEMIRACVKTRTERERIRPSTCFSLF